MLLEVFHFREGGGQEGQEGGQAGGQALCPALDDGTGSAPWKCLTQGVSSAKKLRLKSGLKAHTGPS